MNFDVSGLTPLDTIGLRPAGGDALDVSGLTPLDASGLTPMEEPQRAQQPAGPAGGEEAWKNTSLIDKALNPLTAGALSLKQGAAGLGADLSGRSLAVMDRVDRGETVPDMEDPVGYQHMAPEQRAAARRQAEAEIGQSAGMAVETGRRIADIPQNPAAQRMMGAKTWGDAGRAFWSDPLGVITSVGLQSLPATVPALLAGAVGGPVAGGVAMGASSAGTEYLSSVLEGLANEGVDTNNEAALAQAFRNPELMARVRDHAATRAGIIGTVDGATMGLAGKTLVPQAVRGRLAREALNVPAQIAAQGAAGGAAEAGAQIATEGRITEPGQVLGEVVGEAFGAPAEVLALRHAARPPVDIAPPNVTPADIASPIPTDLISSGRAIVDDLLAPKPVGAENVADLPQGAVPAEVLLGQVEAAEAPAPLPPPVEAAPALPAAETTIAPEPATLDVSGLTPLEPGAAPLSVDGPVPLGEARALPQADAQNPELGSSAMPETAVSIFPPSLEAAEMNTPSTAPAAPALDVTGLRELEQQDGRDGFPGATLSAADMGIPISEQDQQVASQGMDSLSTPMQQDGGAAPPILTKNGKPFSTEKAAALAARQRPDLKGRALEPVRVEDGWGLRTVDQPAAPQPNVAQPEAQAQQGSQGAVDEITPPTPEVVQPPAAPRDLGQLLPPRQTRINDAARSPALLEASIRRADETRNRARQTPEQRRASEAAKADTLRQFDEAAASGVPDWKARSNAERNARSGAVRPKEWERGYYSTQEMEYRTGWNDALAGRPSIDPEFPAAYRAGVLEARAWLEENPRPDGDETIDITARTSRGQETRYNLPADADTIRTVRGNIEKLPADRFSIERDDSGFVRAPDGSPNFGEIGADAATAIGRQPGAIRLREGDAASGLAHIRAGHTEDARQRGYDSVEAMIADVARNYDEIHKGKGRALILVKRDGRRSGATWIQLEPSANGDFYDVKTATPTRMDFMGKQEPAWRRSARRDATGSNGGVATSPAPFSARAQAGEPNVAPERRDGKSEADSFRLAPEFEQALPTIEADLRARLQRYGIADRVGLRLVDAIRNRLTGEPLPPVIIDGRRFDAKGRYLYDRRIIEVALGAENRTFTFDHEVIHALRDLELIRPLEWRALQREVLQDNKRMAGVRERYPEYGRIGDRPERTDRIVEEAVADLFAEWQAGRVQAKGFVRVTLERIRDFLRAVGQALRGEGFRTVDSVFRAIDRGAIGRRGAEGEAATSGLAEAHHAQMQPRDQQGRFIPGAPEDRFSLEDPAAAPAPQAAEARRSLMTRLAGAQPIDRVARLPFDLFGGLNGRNEWKGGLYLNRQAARIITEAEFADGGRLGWMNGILHKARAGLIDRYGLDAAYVERDRQRGLDERRIMAQVPELMKMLADQDVKPEEMQTLQAILTGEEVADARWEGIATPIRQAIDQLGAEAVELGLLSPEAFERYRGKYLHRVYAKHEADQGSLVAWVDRKMTGRRRKVIGDQFKGRGLFMEVTHNTLIRYTDEAQTARARSGQLRALERRRDELLRRRELAEARADERRDEMGATLERRADARERLADPVAARGAERKVAALRDRRATLERQRAEVAAELRAMSGESEAVLGRRMSVTDAARIDGQSGASSDLRPSAFQKGQAREQGVALTRQSAKAERAREALTRLDHEIAAVDQRIERTGGDVVTDREGIEGQVREQAAALTRQNLRNQRARALVDRINGQLADVNGRIVETETRLFAADELKAAKGQRFRVLDKLGEANDGERPRVTRRAYLPEGAAVPQDMEGYQDRGVWEVRGEKNGKVVIWRDFEKAERQAMGEIVDARYTVAKTYMLMAHDLSTGRFFRDIAQNAEWSRDGQDEPPSATWKEAGEYSRFLADPAIQWVKVPDTKIPKSNTKRYGALSGRFVRAEIWRDMAELEAMQKPGLWDSIMRQWKANKTYRSPVVHMNNIMSNVMFMDMADVRAADLVRAMISLQKRDDLYREALDQGAFGSNMLAQEIREEVLKPILEEIERQGQANMGAMEARFGVAGKLADRLFAGVKAADRKMMNAYQIEDEVFRMALYLRRRDQGASPEQAALEAKDTFLDYDIRAPWVNAAKRYALPFISYTYRAAPMIARTLMARPWKLAKYFTMMYALNALAYAIDGGDEDEERRSLRENEQGWAWTGIPRMLRLPTHDQHGNPVFLDVRRWIPAGDVFDTGQGQSVVPLPGWMQPGGPLMIAAELLLNRSAFTGQDISNKLTDTVGERIGKAAGHAYKSWIPSAAWIPGSWYWDRIGNAITGARDWSGRPYSVPQAVASSVGIKVKPQDVQEGFAAWGREFGKAERDLQAEARRASNDRERGLLSETGFERAMERLTKKLEQLGERRRETFEGMR
ncbi:hypothetical protein J2847_004146 [Azospirillum agricola]|uniref:hypothetical protein n=1 Tax=Azospirillum agricola TaxID=1720247 RepID=UPI001AE1A755|nr:hypothetical protein [Azospirillum agricola]MBP2230837.1 hypothetical protein [Azospirillum agricola]